MALVVGVDAGGGFIEDHDRRILQNAARDGDTDSIRSVDIMGHLETKRFGDEAIEQLPAKNVEVQSHEVDAVSSAIMISDAIKAAVKDCVEQARANSVPQHLSRIMCRRSRGEVNGGIVARFVLGFSRL